MVGMYVSSLKICLPQKGCKNVQEFLDLQHFTGIKPVHNLELGFVITLLYNQVVQYLLCLIWAKPGAKLGNHDGRRQGGKLASR